MKFWDVKNIEITGMQLFRGNEKLTLQTDNISKT